MKLEIEAKLGELEWQEFPDGKDFRIIKFRYGESANEQSWSELHEWLEE